MLLLVAGAQPSEADQAPQKPDQEPPTSELFTMEFEQFLKIEIKGAAGLTKTDSRRVPVAITELDDQDVAKSGAKDLDHLLEAYVPNSQMIDHHHHLPHIGYRGVISDREDKYLFQVNGRTMNNRMGTGADNERAIPLLGDVHAVTVVRGPASATHGAGALAGVIDVETYNGLTFQGADLALRQGVADQYTAGEARFGRKFGETSGLFAYYGLADRQGADADSSHYYLGTSYPAANGLPPNVAGTPLVIPMANLGAPAFDSLDHKAHVSFVSGPFELWTRFVQDGYEDRPGREIYRTTKPPDLDLDVWDRGRAFRNRQFTAAATYRESLGDHWTLALMQTFDRWSFRELRMGTQLVAPDPRTGGESEWFSRAIATWSPSATQSVALGAEHSHESFDDPYFSDALDREPVISQREWATDTMSLLAEYQWKIDPRWTAFLSARTDHHTYTDWLFSPRVTLVCTPTERDTLKLMAGQSVRRSGDSELWAQHVRLETIPKPESLRSYELSHERKVGVHWLVGANAFFEDYDAIGWVPALYESTSIGSYQIAGGEILVTFTTAHTRLVVSQGIAKLVAASVPDQLPAGGQGITSEPYGYGHDLANWAPSITKIAAWHEVGKRWTASSSLIYYSGFPGALDYSRYAATLPNPPSAVPLSDLGYTEPYGPNLYMNVGLEYHPSEHVVLRADGYNLVALVDEKLSKRNYYFRLSEFSVQPASLRLSLRYRF